MAATEDNVAVKVESSTNEIQIDEGSRIRKYPNRFNRNKGYPRNRPGPASQSTQDGDEHMQYKDKFIEKVQQLAGPTFNLPVVNPYEKKFCGRNRLYIGNTGGDITEDDIASLFSPFGEFKEVFINKDKNFAFVKFDFYSNAMKAKRELDGFLFKSRNLKIRFAPSCATVKVKNLTENVSNELLHFGFRIFGDIEKAAVCVDERGRSKGEGIIDFARKHSAIQAINKCKEGCFFLTGALRPCIVEPYDTNFDVDGLPEKSIPKRNNQTYSTEREVGPSFASPGNYKYEYGQRWKQLYELFKEKDDALKTQFELEQEKLEAQMEYAKYDHETEILREQLRFRELDRDRQKREWEMKEKQMEEQRRKIEDNIRIQQEELENSMRLQEESIRIRQKENKMFLQKHKTKEFGLSPSAGEYEQTVYSPAEVHARGYWVNNENTNNYMKRRRFM